MIDRTEDEVVDEILTDLDDVESKEWDRDFINDELEDEDLQIFERVLRCLQELHTLRNKADGT